MNSLVTRLKEKLEQRNVSNREYQKSAYRWKYCDDLNTSSDTQG